MKDLDKIKELVATCDSQNIELAIAIGVNMEGYDRNLLVKNISESINDNEHNLYSINRDNKGVPMSVTINKIKVYDYSYKSSTDILTNRRIDIINGWIDAYISL